MPEYVKDSAKDLLILDVRVDRFREMKTWLTVLKEKVKQAVIVEDPSFFS